MTTSTTTQAATNGTATTQTTTNNLILPPATTTAAAETATTSTTPSTAREQRIDQLFQRLERLLPEYKEFFDSLRKFFRNMPGPNPIPGPTSDYQITRDNTPTIKGSAEPNSDVEIFSKKIGTDGQPISLGKVKADANGKWTFTVSDDKKLADGRYEITAKSKDSAGNESPLSQPLKLLVDTAGPGVPTFVTPNNVVTNNNKPTVEGKAEANAEVEIFRKTGANGTAVSLGKVKADADGKWSYTFKDGQADGDYFFSAKAIDIAKNESAVSEPIKVTIDTKAPNQPIFDVLGDLIRPLLETAAGTTTTGTTTTNSTTTVDSTN